LRRFHTVKPNQSANISAFLICNFNPENCLGVFKRWKDWIFFAPKRSSEMLKQGNFQIKRRSTNSDLHVVWCRGLYSIQCPTCRLSQDSTTILSVVVSLFYLFRIIFLIQFFYFRFFKNRFLVALKSEINIRLIHLAKASVLKLLRLWSHS